MPSRPRRLFARAELDRRRGRTDEALAGFDAAQKTARRRSVTPICCGRSITARRSPTRRKATTAAAIDALTAAVRLIEGVRNRLQEPRFRAGYVEDKYEVYIELVRLQLDQGLTSDAFGTAERLRARSYAEQLGGAIVVRRCPTRIGRRRPSCASGSASCSAR